MTDETSTPEADYINFRTYSPTTRRGIDVEIDAVFRERDEALRQLGNVTRLLNEQHREFAELSRKHRELQAQSPIELTTPRDYLNAAIEHINTVVTRQHDLLDGTGSLARAADIRRRQIAKGYTREHDGYHGPSQLIGAAQALIAGDVITWPGRWDLNQFRELRDSPDRLLHAAALICAAQDVIDTQIIDAG